MWIFISVGKTVECIVIALAFAAGMAVICDRPAGVLQSYGYRSRSLFSWAGEKCNMFMERITLLAICCALTGAVLGLAFSFAGEYSAVVSLAGYAIFLVLYGVSDRRRALPCPAHRSARLTRLKVINFVVSAIISYIAVTLLCFADDVWGAGLFTCLRYVPLVVLQLLCIPVLTLSNLIAKIYDAPRKSGLRKACAAAAGDAGCRKVAVVHTGAYHTLAGEIAFVIGTGRTVYTPSYPCVNVCDVAAAVSSGVFRACDTAIFDLTPGTDRDLSEMLGCLRPDTVYLDGADGNVFDICRDYNMVICGGDALSGGIPRPEKITVSPKGTAFVLAAEDGGHALTTPLLGECAARGLAAAYAEAVNCGMDPGEIASAISSADMACGDITARDRDGITVLEAPHVCDIAGAGDAMGVLESCPGRRTAVTRGLIRKGILDSDANRAFGAMLSSADEIVLIGETLLSPIKDALKDSGYPEEGVKVFSTQGKAEEYLAGTLKAGNSVMYIGESGGRNFLRETSYGREN